MINSLNGSFPVWKRAEDIGLIGASTVTWDSNTEALHRSGICKNDEGGQIMWDGLSHQGSISVSDTYLFICGISYSLQHISWFNGFWNTQVPYKIMLYAWIAWKNITLTWDNLMKRGIYVPNQCVLRRRAAESNYHLLLDYPITVDVWS